MVRTVTRLAVFPGPERAMSETNPSILSHVSIGTNDFEATSTLYAKNSAWMIHPLAGVSFP